MPVTIAHPAAVLPLKRWCPRIFNFAALVAGSMAPDLAYVFHYFQLSASAHSFTLNFLINLPAGLFLLIVYFLSRNLIATQLPSPHREYWQDQTQNFGFSGFSKTSLTPSVILILLVSLLLGSATHVVWDSFTHQHGVVVNAVPFLSLDLFSGYGLHLKVYKFLQYFSGIVGLIFIGLFYRHELAEKGSPALDASINEHATLKFLALFSLAILAAGLITLVQSRTELDTTIAHIVFLFVVNSTVSLPITLLVSGLFTRQRYLLKNQESDRS